MHPLLQRQLKRLMLDPACCPIDEGVWQTMLERISQSYAEGDQGRTLLEQSLDVTSREMQGLYEELRCSSETDRAKERTSSKRSCTLLETGCASSMSSGRSSS